MTTPIRLADATLDVLQRADRETVTSAAVDAGRDQLLGFFLKQLGRIAPAAEVALEAGGLAAKIIGAKLIKDAHIRRAEWRRKQKELSLLSPAELRRLKRVQRCGIGTTLLERIGDDWVDKDKLLKDRATRREENKEKLRRAMRGACLALAGKVLRNQSRNITAGTVTAAAIAAAPAAVTAVPFGAFALGAAAFVATAVGLHKAIHFVTGKDDPFAPLLDFAVMAVTKKDNVASAARLMKQRYGDMRRHIATMPERIKQSITGKRSPAADKSQTAAIPRAPARRTVIPQRFALLPVMA